MKRLLLYVSALSVFVLASSAGSYAQPAMAPTSDEAVAFVESAEATLYDLGVKAGRAAWVQANFITYDTEILAAEANENYVAAAVDLAGQAARFNDLDLPYDVARKLNMLRTGMTMPAPSDPVKTL